MRPADPAAPGAHGARWLAWLRPLADAIVPVAVLRGKAAGSGEIVSVLVAGSRPRVQWLLDRFFEGAPACESLGHVPAWRLARTLKRHGASADLAIARVARLSVGPLGFDDDWLPVPDWIGMRIDAPFDLRAIARRNHSVSDDLRRVRRGGYAIEIARGAQDFVAFHRGVYLPFVRNRHREEAFFRSARYLRRRFRRGGILWLARGGERVAAALFERRGDVLDLVALGVVRGDLALVKEGAMSALYAHVLEHARTTGCSAVDLRGSRPSPLDGLTRFKRKWGARAYDRPEVVSTTLVRWRRLTPAVASLLERVPLIFREDGGLSAAGIADGADPASSLRALRMPELRRRILATHDPHPEGVRREDGISIVRMDADMGPRALLAAADARAS